MWTNFCTNKKWKIHRWRDLLIPKKMQKFQVCFAIKTTNWPTDSFCWDCLLAGRQVNRGWISCCQAVHFNCYLTMHRIITAITVSSTVIAHWTYYHLTRHTFIYSQMPVWSIQKSFDHEHIYSCQFDHFNYHLTMHRVRACKLFISWGKTYQVDHLKQASNLITSLY